MRDFRIKDRDLEKILTPYGTPQSLEILPDIRRMGRNTTLRASLDENAKALAQQKGIRSPESPSSIARRKLKSQRSKRKKVVQASLPFI